MTHHVVTFDSAQAFYDAASQAAPKFDGVQPSRDRHRNSQSWDLAAGFDGTVKLAREGWPEGREQVANLAGRLTARVTERNASLMKPTFTRSIVGGAPDVARFIAGRPDSMIARKVQPVPVPVVRIRLDASASGAIGADTMVKRGAAICALVELLEMTGRRCEVGVAFVASATPVKRGDVIDVLAVAKRPAEPLQMDQLAFMLAHPGAFRRLAFSVWEQAPAAIRTACKVASHGSYGYPAGSEQWPDADVVIGHVLSGKRWDEAESERWIIDQLRSQGVEVGE